MKLLSCVWLLATHWTAAHQAPLSVEFSRQEYWSGVPLPSPMLALRGEYYDLQQEGSIMISNLQMRKLRIKKFEINWVISHNWYKAVWGWSFHAGLHCGPCASLAGQPTPLHVNCVCSAIRRKTFMSKTPRLRLLGSEVVWYGGRSLGSGIRKSGFALFYCFSKWDIEWVSSLSLIIWKNGSSDMHSLF